MKITEEQKKQMIQMNNDGCKRIDIAKHFNVMPSSVRYHTCEKYKEITKHFSKTQKKRPLRKGYMKDYMMKRRNEDPEFNERVKMHARNYNRRKNGNSNNIQ